MFSKVLCFNFLLYYFTAQSFFACFRGSQEDYHEEDLSKLSAITRREHMKSNELMGTLRYMYHTILIFYDAYMKLYSYVTFRDVYMRWNLKVTVCDTYIKTS